MENILDNFDVSTMTAQTSGVLVAFSPVITLILGILLAFLVISAIIGLIRGGKQVPDDDDEIDDFDDE